MSSINGKDLIAPSETPSPGDNILIKLLTTYELKYAQKTSRLFSVSFKKNFEPELSKRNLLSEYLKEGLSPAEVDQVMPSLNEYCNPCGRERNLPFPSLKFFNSSPSFSQFNTLIPLPYHFLKFPPVSTGNHLAFNFNLDTSNHVFIKYVLSPVFRPCFASPNLEIGDSLKVFCTLESIQNPNWQPLKLENSFNFSMKILQSL